MEKTNNGADFMIAAIIEAYVKVYGAAKWAALTAEEQHAAVMIIARDFEQIIDRL